MRRGRMGAIRVDAWTRATRRVAHCPLSSRYAKDAAKERRGQRAMHRCSCGATLSLTSHVEDGVAARAFHHSSARLVRQVAPARVARRRCPQSSDSTPLRSSLSRAATHRASAARRALFHSHSSSKATYKASRSMRVPHAPLTSDVCA